MATCSAPSIVSLKASNPVASLAPAPCPPSRAPALPKGFLGLRASKGFRPLSTRLASAKRSSSRSFCVKAAFESDLPLVGNKAPDFEAEAVFDQDFINFSHLAWVQMDRKSGGLGDLKYPLISDVTKSISKYFGVLIPDQGIALRGLFIIDKEGVIQHSTINNIAIGRSVDETMRTLQVISEKSLQDVQENPDEVCPARS